MSALRLLAAILLALPALAGCASERDELERERESLRQQREYLDGMLRNAPQGNRWNDHPDTHSIYRGMDEIDQRVSEIDCQLAR